MSEGKITGLAAADSEMLPSSFSTLEFALGHLISKAARNSSEAFNVGIEIVKLFKNIECKNNGFVEQIKQLNTQISELQERCNTGFRGERGDFWVWQGDGEDHLGSLVRDAPILITAGQLRRLISESMAVSGQTEPPSETHSPSPWLSGLLRDLDRNRDDGRLPSG